MRVYVAGPMRGLPDHGRAAFAAAAAALRAQGHEVFNPSEQGEAHDLPALRRVFGADTAWICANADAIALLPGWQDSKGATAEADLGFALGISVAPIEALLYRDVHDLN